MICSCPEPGHCSVLMKDQSERQWLICQDKILTPEDCSVYRKNWLALAHNAHCQHIGDITRKQQCSTCQGNVGVKIFSCAVHGECTVLPTFQSVKSCQDCNAFKPRENISK